jgi:uncharacterized protein (DUF924 family)
MLQIPEEIINEIIQFWFEETSAKQKFSKDLEFDELIKLKFRDIYNDIVAGNTVTWRKSAHGRLAEIIVLDQFSRNMFRGNSKSFAEDKLALKLAMEAVEAGADKKLTKEHRVFIYMPYMHSESAEVHKKALELFTELGSENNLEYEIKHKSIIDRFGRYPHRNKLLGRESTPEELEFLKIHSGF